VEAVACGLCGARDADLVLVAPDRLARPSPTPVRHTAPAGTRALPARHDAARDPEAECAATPRLFSVVRCRSCGLAYTSPRPSPSETAAFYPDDYWGRETADGLTGDDARQAPPPLRHWVEDAYRRRQQREVVRWLARLRPARGRLLDVGCGRGDLLTALRADGWRAQGVEPSAAAAETARRRFGLDVVTGTLEDADLRDDAGAGPLFDAVVFAGVVEHVPDPLATLRRARALLAPGGLLAVLFLPRFDSLQARLFGPRWLALDLPRHLYHFDDDSWRRLLAETGLRLEAMEPYSSRHSATMWVASAFPALHKHRFYLAEAAGETALRRLARELAYLVLTTLVRPLCRLEARAGLDGQRSYFLVGDG
jgi:SAM-dependent methyltransferase